MCLSFFFFFILFVFCFFLMHFYGLRSSQVTCEPLKVLILFYILFEKQLFMVCFRSENMKSV